MLSHRLISSVLYGVLAIFIIVIAASFISSVILRYTEIAEGTFLWILIILSFIALFIGGYISGGRTGERGWFAGALTALVYSLTVFLTQYLSFNETFDLQQLLMHSGYLITGVFGGMIGVNIHGNSHRDS
ncbi:TIGR04086 family membrane protein [Salipaludibacillus aurantiacus]|uniref:Putative membrane protein, TIGR04086 family n=1 Tax=Salipaludibacillus aurantiacus TaxID=1601833 RepID=A0A1H9RKI2_9BACI|nr:TIGR04086 family membrane protein [Salipaludibacillus aurantiacus]SER73147.1 putative membrane protein, TIGR04086 family [Salipaludibacillus aurantiacus]